jgi:hypothetical protein
MGGGFALIELAWVYVLYFVALLVSGAVGLFASVLFSRVFEAYWVTALLLILLLVVIPYSETILSHLGELFWGYELFLIRYGSRFLELWNPFCVLQDMFYPDLLGDEFRFNPPPDWLSAYSFGTDSMSLRIYLNFAAPLGVIIFLLAYGLLRWMARRPPRARSNRPARQWRGLARIIFFDLDKALTNRWLTPREDAGALLQRRTQWTARLSAQIRFAYIGVILGLITLPVVTYETTFIYLSIPLLLAVIFALPLAATGVNIERERGTLDLLRVSLLPSSQLIASKYWTSLIHALIIAYSYFLPGMLFRVVQGASVQVSLADEDRWLDFLAMLAYLASFGFFLACAVAFALYCSTRFYSPHVSTLTAAVGVIGALLTPWVTSILFGAISSMLFGPGWMTPPMQRGFMPPPSFFEEILGGVMTLGAGVISLIHPMMFLFSLLPDTLIQRYRLDGIPSYGIYSDLNLWDGALPWQLVLGVQLLLFGGLARYLLTCAVRRLERPDE